MKGVLRELLRFGLCGAVVCLGAWAVLTMNGRPVPQWLPLMALVAVQPLQDWVLTRVWVKQGGAKMSRVLVTDRMSVSSFVQPSYLPPSLVNHPPPSD